MSGNQNNRLMYDSCYKAERDNRNGAQLEWTMEGSRFFNQSQCMSDDLIAGNTIGNNDIPSRVDLESQLFGIDNKQNSTCKTANPMPNNVTPLASSPKCQFFDRLAPDTTDYKITNRRCNDSVNTINQLEEEELNLEEELNQIEQYNN